MKHYIPRRITTRFPYMFEGENIGLSVAAGWTAIFEKLCSDIDTLLGEDKRNFHWVQCKEKFGVARWYWEIEGVEPTISVDIVTSEGNLVSFETKNRAPKNGNEQVSVFIRNLKVEAQNKTRHACAACSEPGKVRDKDGWLIVLCDTHDKQLRAGDDVKIWVCEDEGDEDAKS